MCSLACARRSSRQWRQDTPFPSIKNIFQLPLIFVLNGLASNVRGMFKVTLFNSDFDFIMETVYMLETEIVAGDIYDILQGIVPLHTSFRCVCFLNFLIIIIIHYRVSLLRCLQFLNG